MSAGFWNEDRLQILRDLWARGDSGEAIAAAIPGATRNSVLAAARRYDLPLRRPHYSHKVPRPRARDPLSDVYRPRILTRAG